LLLLSLGNGVLLKLFPSELLGLYSLLISQVLLMTVCKMLAISILLLTGLLGWWGQLRTGASCAAGVCLLGLDVGCGFCSASLWYWEVRRCSILGKVWCEHHV